MNKYQALAHRLHGWGFNSTAIKAGEKRPAHRWDAWQEVRQTLDDVNGLPWLDAGGIGIISGIGGLRIFDFDKCDDFGPLALATDYLGLSSGYRWMWRSGSGHGYGLAVLCFDDLPAGAFSTNGNGPGVFKAAGEGFEHLELRWRNCQTVLPPSQHPTGPGYVWLHGEPTEPPATVTAAQVIAAFRAVTVAPAVMLPTNNGDRARAYALAALRDEVAAVRGAAVGNRNNTLNNAALHLGELVAGGELDRADVEHELLDAALAVGLGEGEARATIKSGLDAGARNPRRAPEPERRPVATYRDAPEEPEWLRDAPESEFVWGDDGRPVPTESVASTRADEKNAPKLAIISIGDLLARQWPEPTWIVNDLIPVGLIVLAGRPKIGKSWLALQLVQAVACGGVFLDRRVERRPCLYLALEDPPWRLAERARMQGWHDLDARAHFLTAGNFRRGDGRQLAAIIHAGEYGLVVVDTLGRAFSGDKDNADAMTGQLAPVQEAAHAANCAVLLLHHHNKVGAATTGAGAGGIEPDPLVNLQGSISIGGMADCLMGMYRQKDKASVLLTGYGRDVEEFAFELTFDKTTRVWQATQRGVPKQTDERAAVLAVLEDLGPATLIEINEILKTDKGNLYRRLQNMVALGIIERGEKGRYRLPTT